MNEIYPVQGADLPDPLEPWHWKKAICALTTGIIGIWVMASGLAGAQYGSPALHIASSIPGLIILGIVAAAFIRTKFWTRYNALGAGGRALARLAFYPGGALLFVWWYILYVFFLIIKASLSDFF